ncbi:MAG: Y-family DNA polymerase [Mycoplasmoidaceae bacterium]
MRNNYLLIDMDNFFAACEMNNLNLDDNLPVIIGGYYSKSVVSSCNAAAKKYGVKSAMPIYLAKQLAPNAIFLPTNFQLYEKISFEIEKILLEYTKNISKKSIDEWCLNFSNSKKIFDEIEMANFIKTKIYKKLGMKSSIGVGNNYFNAKMACYFAKPFGIFMINNSNYKNILWKVRIGEMYGVGKKTKLILENNGINNIGDLANYKDKNKLIKILGKNAAILIANANNIDSYSKITKTHSISSAESFIDNKGNYDEIIFFIKKHFKIIFNKLFKNDQVVKTVSINFKMLSNEKNKQYSFKTYQDDEGILFNKLIELFEDNWNDQTLKGIAVGFHNIIYQFELNQKNSEVTIINQINQELGYRAVKWANKIKK